MLSGYAEGMKPPVDGTSTLIRRLKKNFVALYLPCMFFSFLQAFLNLAVFSSSNSIGAHVPTLRHFLMIPFIGFLEYWFLCALFFVKSLHALFERTISREKLHSALWVILFVIYGIYGGNFGEDTGIFGTNISRLWLAVFSRGVYFRLGCVIRRRGYVSRGKTPGTLWGLSLLAAGIAVFFAGGRGFVSSAGTGLCMSLGLLILFYALNVSSVFLSVCGLYSLVIYCTHNYAAAVFRILSKLSGLSLASWPVLAYAVCFSAAMFTPLLVVWLYKNVKHLRWAEYLFYPGKLLH